MPPTGRGPTPSRRLLYHSNSAAGCPVPLSATDLGTYDPSLSSRAASRCLGRLVRTGWLLPQTRRGQKSCYTPTWGPGRPNVGTTKPRRLATVPLPTLAATLARVTQQTLTGEIAIHLTQAGARVLGLPRAVPPPPRPTTNAQPLFFIERHLIGGGSIT